MWSTFLVQFLLLLFDFGNPSYSSSLINIQVNIFQFTFSYLTWIGWGFTWACNGKISTSQIILGCPAPIYWIIYLFPFGFWYLSYPCVYFFYMQNGVYAWDSHSGQFLQDCHLILTKGASTSVLFSGLACFSSLHRVWCYGENTYFCLLNMN